jgi:integrase
LREKNDAMKMEGIISPSVFTLHGKRFKSYYKSWRSACKKAGQAGMLSHDFRRTAVRNLVRAGVSESVAMKMTGHKTRSVFDRYDIVSPGDVNEAAKKLDLFLGIAAGIVSTQKASH